MTGRSTANGAGQWVRTWYGLPARVAPSERGLCDVALLGIPLPHPSLINLALRRGLPDGLKARLFFLHEFGHLQMLPLALLYWLFLRRTRRRRRIDVPLQLAAVQGFWELVTEAYVVWCMGPSYARTLSLTRSPWPVLFWPLMVSLAVLPFLSGLGPSPACPARPQTPAETPRPRCPA